MAVMDGQLVQVCGPRDSASALIALVKDLRQEVAGLRADVQALQRENLELRQQVGYWKSRHRDALGRITALEQKVEQLEGEKRQLQADLFGRRSETRPRNDRSNDLELGFCKQPFSAGKMGKRSPFSVSYAPAQLVPRGI
jgi:DNA repair exonuclease SbcCD ATPase subunit